MANNRVAYGLAKEYGIDTSGKSPKEVWEALKGKGINQDNFAQYQNRQNEGYGKREKTTPSATYRLSYSGEEIPLNKVETLVSKSISKSKWNTNFDDGMDMAIKDAAGELLDKYDDMSYEEAIDLATSVAEKVKKEKSEKIERVATKEMIDVIKANPEAKRVVNELLKNPNLTYDEAVILGYKDFMKKKV